LTRHVEIRISHASEVDINTEYSSIPFRVKGMKYYVELSELPELNIEKAMKAVEN